MPTIQKMLKMMKMEIYFSLTPDEKEVLWEKRHYLRSFPEALPLVLASAVGVTWLVMMNHRATDGWGDTSSTKQSPSSGE